METIAFEPEVAILNPTVGEWSWYRRGYYNQNCKRYSTPYIDVYGSTASKDQVKISELNSDFSK